MNGVSQKILWGLMAGLAWIVVILASRYLTLDPATYFPQQRAVYEARTWAITLHVGGGMIALLLGPVQFLTSLRRHATAVHRWFGRVYLAGILLGGAGGLALAPVAFGGPWPRLGFAGLGIAWLGAGALAYVRIRQGRVEEHRAWMMRSYALTFAAVTLRLELPLLVAVGVSFPVAYTIVAWLSWVGNLVVAEWIVARSRRAGLRNARAQIT